MSAYTTRLDGSVVPARSIENIAGLAMAMRRILKLESNAYFPVAKVYELLPLLFEGADFQVLEDDELGSDHGRTYPDKLLIQLPLSVYERACRGEGRDRFTMCHELGHLLMHRGVAFSRIDPKLPPKIFRNSEWQADTFASHLLMPAHLLAQCATVFDAAETFGVTLQAATARKGGLKK